MSDEKEKSAKELVGSIRRDAVELANKGISAAKKKLHDVDMNQVTSQTKELANKGISTAKEKLHYVIN